MLKLLSIDIGGTAIKMMVLDDQGRSLSPYITELTPHPATVENVCSVIEHMAQHLDISFDRISVGFPGVVKKGVIATAPNMHASWIDLDFQKKLHEMMNCPVRVINDADMQGFGDIIGEGVELVITLGTGVGSAIYTDGKLVPNLELGHHPFENNFTYEMLLGKNALEKEGLTMWNRYLERAILLWQQTFNYDHLYLGGGNAQNVQFKLLPSVTISNNLAGVLGGIKLWGIE